MKIKEMMGKGLGTVIVILILVLFFSGFHLIKLLFTFFNDYYGLLSLILISTGLYFVWKQLRIAKNHDLLFRFQNAVLQYFANNYIEHNHCVKEVESILKRCLLLRDKNEINFIVQANETSNLGSIIENHLSKYGVKPAKKILFKNACYELWLGSEHKKFMAIVESEHFKKADDFHKIYDDIIASLSKIEVLYSSEQSYKQIYTLITEKIKLELAAYDNSYNVLVDEFNLFFKKLAKNKGVL